MCSVPRLPTPGSDVPVLIMRVNLNPIGIVELWVNMDDGRKHIYKRMKEDIQLPKRKFYGSEGKPGDLCLVCISDTWHRARIVSCQSETYNVFLIDQGQPHITPSEALAWGQSESFLLPPKIESCILANVVSLESNWPERATKFLKSLPGKTFKGVVQHVLMPDETILLDIPIISKIMCKFGVAKKIPVDKFKCIVRECLHLPIGEASEVYLKMQEQNLKAECQLEKHDQYFYPELLTDSFETVKVTEVTNPQNFFCKLHIFSKAVELISEQIHQHYEESSNLVGAQPQTCGDPCAARGINGRWHRSLLKQNMTGDDAVEVFHVDEGKTELVPVGNIKPLHRKFLRMPVVTYPCSLDGVKDNDTGWTTDQTDYLKSLILNQTVVARFDHHNIPQDVYYVTLCAANAACINDYFIGKTGPFPPSKTEQDSKVQNESIPSSFFSSLGDARCMDSHNKVVVNVDGLRVETSTENLAFNGRAKDVPTSGGDDIHIKENSKPPDPVIQSNGQLSTGFHSQVQNAHNGDVLTVGRSVNVKVSCIESLQKFWCQTTENEDSLGLLMRDLQNHYVSANPQPFVESICVARNSDNDMWYRARMIASHHSPTVDVSFIDYGQNRKVSLQDVRPIDRAFLRLNAQAFQCCLFNLKNPTNPTADWTDVALAEFQKFVDSSGVKLKCIVKAVTSDNDGQPLYMVDIETPSGSACKLLARKCAQTEAPVQIPPQVSSDEYNYSTHNIEVGGREEVWFTSLENVNHFYCQLDRNSHLFDKVMENIKQLIGQPQSTDHPLGLNNICFARYTDNQWYRGQVVEMSPKLKVHFVDSGHTLAVKESDIRPFPPEAGIARTMPVLAVPLGLFDVPAEVPEGVNQWFADHAVGHSLTISVVAKETKGKLIVELFNGSLNLNEKVRERISKMTQEHFHSNVPNEDCLMPELTNVSVLTKMTEEDSSNKMSARDELRISSQSRTNVSAPEIEHGKTLDEGRKLTTLDVILKDKETVLAETFVQSGHSDSETTQLSLPFCPEGNVNSCMFKRPKLSLNKIEEVYASCIGGPQYFWCQYTNTEELKILSRLAQEAGQIQQDMMFPKTLDPGSPCLALYSDDNRWYRAQVIQRTDNTLSVMFIDYGNESGVDIKNVRPLPQCLLDEAPQAFLCSLNGFDKSKGSWDDGVYDDFYNLLVDKPLRVTVFSVEDHTENGIPQYAVQLECENMVVNDAMQKYWKTIATNHVMTENPQTENVLQGGQTESDMTHVNVSKENVNTCLYKKPNISKNKAELVYASCIVDPHYFWCQYANTEELDKVSRLAQEAGQNSFQDQEFPQTLGPGSPCLALFPTDKQWYRAQIIRKAEDVFHVVFTDYGNESDVDIKNVRSLPQSLLDEAPQAFLCSLNGFDKSKGSWDDEVYEDFYSLLVDKPLKLTVFNMEDNSEVSVPQYSVEIECEEVDVYAAMQKYWKLVVKECVLIESDQIETVLQDGQTESNKIHLNVSKGNVNTYMYTEPNISKNKTELVYASFIVDPHYFWCQYANTEELDKVSRLAQEAGQNSCQDQEFPQTLGPGSPCLALFPTDKQWYRVQVIQRTDNTLNVMLIDYGNEFDVDIKNVRPLPQCLLDEAPQAFLCSLNGFDKTKGSWDDEVHKHFFSILIDKPLKLTVFSVENNSEVSVPQYSVEIECEVGIVNTLMEKYWRTKHRSCLGRKFGISSGPR